MKQWKVLSTLVTLLFLSGCASIIGSTDQLINISSSPDNATITITDEKGERVFLGSTPSSVTLAKSDGSYFGGKTYTVDISMPGYQSRSVRIESRPNGWYIAGNLVFGGFIGWLIVDPLTGAMYNLTPSTIGGHLGASNAMLSADSIAVILLDDVPDVLRDDMIAL